MFGDGLIHVRFVSSNHIDAASLHLDHTQSAPMFRCRLKELGQLADRQTVSRRDRVIRGEESLSLSAMGLRRRAADRIRPIQHKDRQLYLRSFFEQ
jgi:hypothetical protein